MEANLRRRLITASVGIVLLVGLVSRAGPFLFAAVIVAVTGGALWEYFAMAFPRRRRERIFGVAFGLLVSLPLVFQGLGDGETWLAGLLLLLFSIYLFIDGPLEERFLRLAWTLLGALYLGYLLPHWVLLFNYPDGRRWVFFVLLVVMTGDTVAYFVGNLLGRRKLAPQISPGKTVEGGCGFLAGGILAGIAGARYLLPGLGWGEAALLAGTLSILGQLGDLFESWVKRVFSVKDSGALLPGHGGLLDRLDSLIFPVVYLSYYVRFFH